jgi:hypothetical protein
MLYSADVFKKGTYYTPSDKNEEPFINEMDMPGFVSMPVEAGLLMKLFNALNQSLPPDSMMMDAEIFKVLVNDSTIQLVARNLKLAEKLNGYSQKAKLIKEIIAQESFHSFLKSHMDTVCIYNMNADYWDRIMITVVTAKQSYRFEGNTKDNFRQAWYEFENKDVSKISRCVLNRNINETLLQMLPMKFNSRFFLEKRAMTESYIEWCLRSQLH